jgi:hypothetical protein
MVTVALAASLTRLELDAVASVGFIHPPEWR